MMETLGPVLVATLLGLVVAAVLVTWLTMVALMWRATLKLVAWMESRRRG